jgi:hypothetical protein
MLDPVVQSALVVLIAYLLDLAAKYFGIPLSTEVLASLAAAIVAWLVGTASGARVAEGIRGSFRARNAKG